MSIHWTPAACGVEHWLHYDSTTIPGSASLRNNQKYLKNKPQSGTTDNNSRTMKVHFTPALKRFVPDLHSIEVQGSTVADVINNVAEIYPGLTEYIIEENGALRQHVNIFINNTFISDRKTLGDAVQDTDDVYIIQALSGG